MRHLNACVLLFHKCIKGTLKLLPPQLHTRNYKGEGRRSHVHLLSYLLKYSELIDCDNNFDNLGFNIFKVVLKPCNML